MGIAWDLTGLGYDGLPEVDEHRVGRLLLLV